MPILTANILNADKPDVVGVTPANRAHSKSVIKKKPNKQTSNTVIMVWGDGSVGKMHEERPNSDS